MGQSYEQGEVLSCGISEIISLTLPPLLNNWINSRLGRMV